MKNLSACILFTFVFFILSCTQRNEGSTQPAKEKEIPKALEENDSYTDIKISKRSYEDLVDQLYTEEQDKNPDLQKLEKDLDDYKDSLANTNDRFTNYNDKSNNYYSAAYGKVASLKDSALRKKIEAIIQQSQANYANKTRDLNALMNTIARKDNDIADQRTVLKILLSLSIMEKYQANHKPDKKLFEKQIREQEQLLKRLEQVK